jgi:hypothetical protein
MGWLQDWCRCTSTHREQNCDREHYWLFKASEEEVRNCWKAMMLADSLEVCEALLRGESVPVERLRPEWVKRFGRRK